MISDQVSFAALVEWACDKIRHANLGIPAVMIRQLEALTMILGYTTDPLQADAVPDQAARISQSSSEVRMEESARARIQRRYNALVDVHNRLGLESPSGA